MSNDSYLFNDFTILPKKYLNNLSIENFMDFSKNYLLMLSDDGLIDFSRKFINELDPEQFSTVFKPYLYSLDDKNFESFSKNAIRHTSEKPFSYYAGLFLDDLKEEELVDANIYIKENKKQFFYKTIDFKNIIINCNNENFHIDKELISISDFFKDFIFEFKQKGLGVDEIEKEIIKYLDFNYNSDDFKYLLKYDKIKEEAFYLIFYSETEIEKCKKQGLSSEDIEARIVYDTSYKYNPKIAENIINFYIYKNSIYSFPNSVADQKIKDIELLLNISLGKEENIKILKNEHFKYSKKLQKNSYYNHFYQSTKKTDIRDENSTFNKEFLTYLKQQLNNIDYLIDDFLRDKFTMEDLFEDEWGDAIDEFDMEYLNNTEYYNFEGFDLLNYSIFRGINHMYECLKIIDFIKSKLESINKVESPNLIATIQDHHPIFNNPDVQKIFFELLLEMNAIDTNLKPRPRKFQPICDAIFLCRSNYKNEIFRYNNNIADYIKFLKEIFPNAIKGDKLSSGTLHIEKVNELLSLKLKQDKDA